MNCNKVNKNINVRRNDSSTKSIMKKIHDKLQSISQGEALIGLWDTISQGEALIGLWDTISQGEALIGLWDTISQGEALIGLWDMVALIGLWDMEALIGLWDMEALIGLWDMVFNTTIKTINKSRGGADWVMGYGV